MQLVKVIHTRSVENENERRSVCRELMQYQQRHRSTALGSIWREFIQGHNSTSSTEAEPEPCRAPHLHRLSHHRSHGAAAASRRATRLRRVLPGHGLGLGRTGPVLRHSRRRGGPGGGGRVALDCCRPRPKGASPLPTAAQAFQSQLQPRRVQAARISRVPASLSDFASPDVFRSQ